MGLQSKFWQGFLPARAIIMAPQPQAHPPCEIRGEGHPHASLVFVGESPEEAGKLLDRMIAAMTLKREEVYLCPLVQCRPCLERLLDSIQPRVIVALGELATQMLLQTGAPLTQLRGAFQPYRDTQLMPTFHPSYLLENPEAKKEAWSDLKQVALKLGLQLPTKKG